MNIVYVWTRSAQIYCEAPWPAVLAEAPRYSLPPPRSFWLELQNFTKEKRNHF